MTGLEIRFNRIHRNFIIVLYTIVAFGAIVSFIPLLILFIISLTIKQGSSIQLFFLVSLPFFFIMLYSTVVPLIDAFITPSKVLIEKDEMIIYHGRKCRTISIRDIYEIKVQPYRRITSIYAKGYWVKTYYSVNENNRMIKFDFTPDDQRNIYINHILSNNCAVTVTEIDKEQIRP